MLDGLDGLLSIGDENYATCLSTKAKIIAITAILTVSVFNDSSKIQCHHILK
jgi:hypothetical protein